MLWIIILKKTTIRFKTVGQLGRHQGGKQYSQDEFITLVANQLSSYGVTEEHIKEWQKKDPDQFVLSFSFPLLPLVPRTNIKFREGIWIKLPHWNKEDRNSVFEGRKDRGRLTQDFKVANFFEHVLANEFKY